MSEPLLDRLPPSSVEAEQSVLGCLLLDPDALVKVGAPPLALQADDFSREGHRDVYAAMLDLWRRNDPLDIVTVTDELERRGQLASAGGPAYIHSLPTVVPTAIHVEHYARIVQRTALRRRLIGAAGRIVSLGYDDATEVEAAVAEAVSLVMALGDGQTARGGHVRDILARMETEPSPEPIGCHIPTLRNVLAGGFRPGNLYVFAAPPSAGKTTLLVDLAVHALLDHGAGVVHITLENPDDEMVERYLGNLGDVSNQSIQWGRFTPEEADRYDQAKRVLGLTPLLLYDASVVQQAAEIAMLTALAKAHHPDVSRWLVIVDYVQLLQPAKHRENEAHNVDAVMRELQRLAITEKVPVLLASSLPGNDWEGDVRNWAGRNSTSVKGYALFFCGLVPDTEKNDERARFGPLTVLDVGLQITKNRRGIQYARIPCDVVAATGKWRELTHGAAA